MHFCHDRRFAIINAYMNTKYIRCIRKLTCVIDFPFAFEISFKTGSSNMIGSSALFLKYIFCGTEKKESMIRATIN